MRITTQSPLTVNMWGRPHFLTPFCRCEHRFWEIFDQNWLTTQLTASIVLPLRRHPGLQFGRLKSLSMRARGQTLGPSEGYTSGMECRPWAGQPSTHDSWLLSYRVLSAEAKGRVKLRTKSSGWSLSTGPEVYPLASVKSEFQPWPWLPTGFKVDSTGRVVACSRAC